MLKVTKMGKKGPRVRVLFMAVVVVVVIGVMLSMSGVREVMSETHVATSSHVLTLPPPLSPPPLSSPPPPPPPPVTSRVSKTSSKCSELKTCAECLSNIQCRWCAIKKDFDVSIASGECQSTSDTSDCLDSETTSCPAILNTKLPSNFRVIHVGIQKGGPEALIQLHLSLIYWGFSSTLDTRRNKQGGSIKSFFRINYEHELKRSPPLRWFDSYDKWLTTGMPEDVFIETETWACKPDFVYSKGKGRQLQWHLTVWKKKNREACTIAAHTHYIAHDYMEISDKAILYPYISPHIHKLAEKNSKSEISKENLILYDADAGITDADFAKTAATVRNLKFAVAAGLKPEQLYDKYAKAKVCIDMKLPGAERFVYEAALFGCPIVTDDTLNGKDNFDLPLMPQYRLPSGDVGRLNDIATDIILNFDSHKKNFGELKKFVSSQRVVFLRQVRKYFSDNVHIIATCSEQDGITQLIQFLLSHILIIPFATIEIICCHHDLFSHQIISDLRERTLLSAVHFRKSDVCDHKIFPEPTYSQRMKYTLGYKGLNYVPNALDLVSILSTQMTVRGSDKITFTVGSNDVLFTTSSHFSNIQRCWSSCESVIKLTQQSMYRSDLTFPLIDVSPGEALDFLCKHPVYANASRLLLLPVSSRCQR